METTTPQEIYEYWIETVAPTVCPNLVNDDFNARLIEGFVFRSKKNIFSPENLTAAIQDPWVASQLHLELTPEEKAAKAEQERLARITAALQTTVNLWLERHCPTGLKAANGEPLPADADRMIEFLKRNCDGRYENGTITVEDLNAAVRTLTESGVLTYFDRSEAAMKIRNSKEDESDRDQYNRKVAVKWLKERCPSHLKHPKGGMGVEYSAKMNAYLEANYHGTWTFDNLDKCVHYLMGRGELPSPKKPGISTDEQAANNLHNHGIKANTGRANHAEKTDNKTFSMQEAAKKLFGDIRKMGQPSAEPTTSKERVRVLPDNATPQQLKAATPAELHAFLQRKQGRGRR